MMRRVVKGTGGMGRAFARFRFRAGVEGAPAVAPFVGDLMGGLSGVLGRVGLNVTCFTLHLMKKNHLPVECKPRD